MYFKYINKSQLLNLPVWVKKNSIIDANGNKILEIYNNTINIEKLKNLLNTASIKDDSHYLDTYHLHDWTIYKDNIPVLILFLRGYNPNTWQNLNFYIIQLLNTNNL